MKHPPIHGRRDHVSVHTMLLDLGLVDTPPDERFDRFTRLVEFGVKVPVALVSFVEEDRDRQVFKSQIGLTGHWAEARQTPLSHSFCQYVKRENRPLIVENATEDARVCDNLAIPDLGVRAYLGVPMHDPEGNPLGALCAIDTVPRVWETAEIIFMTDLATCVDDEIRLRAGSDVSRL